jgi:hypothetical protein
MKGHRGNRLLQLFSIEKGMLFTLGHVFSLSVALHLQVNIILWTAVAFSSTLIWLWLRHVVISRRTFAVFVIGHVFGFTLAILNYFMFGNISAFLPYCLLIILLSLTDYNYRANLQSHFTEPGT